MLGDMFDHAEHLRLRIAIRTAQIYLANGTRFCALIRQMLCHYRYRLCVALATPSGKRRWDIIYFR
jgi:hypothetical protein